MIASCLMLVLIVLFGLANHSSCQTCDLFNQRSERCLSLSTNTFCGMPPVTQEQIRQAREAAETIRMIEQIGGPIVDGSQEALQLGISVDNPIVNLTVEQGNFYRRCQGSNLLTPDTSFTLKRNILLEDLRTMAGLTYGQKVSKIGRGSCNTVVHMQSNLEVNSLLGG